MNISDNLQTIGNRIRHAEKAYGRRLNSVQLLAVSKLQPVSSIREAIEAGQLAFGENYAQEMAEKAQALDKTLVEWHFIGPIQSNKTRLISNIASWVHSVDNVRIAQRLNDQRPIDKGALNVCIQVNISGENTKSGVAPDQVLELARVIRDLPNLTLRGLMAIPAPQQNVAQQRAVFAQVYALQKDLIRQGFALNTLSMGMTDDMEAAIAEGSTLVRIGTAIFGSRTQFST